MKRDFVRLNLVATVLLMLVIMQGRGESAYAAAPATSANTQIVNAATATWQDRAGNTYQESSNEVVVTVQGVSALTVTPKEASANAALDGYPVGQNVTRTFVITNVSNIADAYRITSFTADQGHVSSLSFVSGSSTVPITVGSTVSAVVQPGATIAVQAVVTTAGIAVGTSFALHMTAQTTASGTANGLQSDTGQQWLVTATGASLGGPGGANTPISKTVDHQAVVQSQGGAIVTFDVTVKNNGGSPATNAVMTDSVPPGLTADLTTVKINGVAVAGATLSGQMLMVPLGTLGAGVTDDISFNSLVASIDTLGTTFVNVASISADGVSPISTTPAAVLIGTADLVFDPANNNSPVAGASVSLLNQNNQLVPITTPIGPSVRNRFTQPASGSLNPVVTGPDGTYGFALLPSQIAAAGTTFYVTIAAPGYLNRRIQIFVTPATQNLLYNVVATSNDGQPLAKAGSYTLTTGSVSLNNIFGLFGNLPLFRTQAITISKTVDRVNAQPGDRLVYTVDVSNPSGSTLNSTNVIDTLPPGEAYAAGSARVNGKKQEPSINGRVLTWSLPALASGVRYEVIYAAVVYPNVPSGTILSNSATAQAIISGTMVNVNAAANADVIVVQGALSDRSVITGRVFADIMKTGHFMRGDRGIGGVRVFMEDGTSATTDAEGRFSFPAARPGMHVLRIDRTTLPDGAGGTFQRLLHGVLDDGLMQDIEFAVKLP